MVQAELFYSAAIAELRISPWGCLGAPQLSRAAPSMATRALSDTRPESNERFRAENGLASIAKADASVLKLPSGMPRTARLALICSLLFFLVVWAFWPSVSNDFVNFDDNVYVSENAHVQAGLTWDSLGWAFTTLKAGFWNPLTWLSLTLDYQLFGLRAGGYHLTSLLLHATSTVLLFLLFRRMTGATWRSAFVAVLFGVHPLHVESVAWVAERKDVLSTLFWLLTLLAYVKYVELSGVTRREPGEGGLKSEMQGPESSIQSSALSPPRLSILHPPSLVFYILALVCFACGLMSKAMVVTLPLVLLLLDWWPLRRFHLATPTDRDQAFGSDKSPARFQWAVLRSLLLEKVPFLVIALIAGAVTVFAQRSAGALRSTTRFPVPERLVNTILSYARYLVQTVWPSDLAVFYPYPKTFSAWVVVAATLLFLTVSIFVVRAWRTRPYLVFGWLWYVVTLLPVIGLIQAGYQSHADRYTYVPLAGLFAALAWSTHELTRRWRYHAPALFSVALTRRQIGYWFDSESLFRHTLSVTEDNSIIHYNLGLLLFRQGKTDEAIANFQAAVEIQPRYVDAHDNLGVALLQAGKPDAGIAHLKEAARLAPGRADLYYNLGIALGEQGQTAQAIGQFQEALQLNPGFAGAHSRLGDVLLQQGQVDDAIAHFRRALEIQPSLAEADCKLGIALLRTGQLDEALVHLQRALEIRPGFAEAHYNLGKALFKKGQDDETLAQFQRAVQIDPKLANAQSDLGTLLVQRGRMDEAMEHYQRALELQPTNVSFLNNLAWVLATCPNPEVRNGARAVELAQKAERLGGAENSAIVGTLAAAYAEAGRFGEAVRTAERALNLATAQTNTAQIGLLRTNIALYAAGLPLRDTSQTNTFPNPNRP